MNTIILLLLLSASTLFAKGRVEISDPVWLLPPETTKGVLSSDLPVEWKTSKNNLAITYADGRFYAAVRTADHHHPKPPAMGPYWLNRKLDIALRYLNIPGGLSSFLSPPPEKPTTRLFVFSAAVPLAQLRAVSQTLLNSLTWRLEFEAHDKWKAATSSLSVEEIGKLLGDEEKARFVPAILDEPDLREPHFIVKNNRLIFYFVAIEGAAQKFNPLRTWGVAQKENGEWAEAVPLFEPKELLWDLKTGPGPKPLYFATTYLGGHYQAGDDATTRVFLKSSPDGFHWETVGKNTGVYEGGANEAGFEFDTKGNLWSVLRLDDGDVEKGWGALLAFAPANALGDWQFPALADPRRFDSPRFFRSGSEIYLVARQNIITGHEGNAPYDLSFVNRTPEQGSAQRSALIASIKKGDETNKGADIGSLIGHFVGLGGWMKRRYPIGVFYEYDFSYWGKYPKRTAIYHLNQETRTLDLVVTLPSAGDTAFPSILKLTENEFLIANYSSPFDKKDWTWGIGQKNPTGVYLINAKVNP